MTAQHHNGEAEHPFRTRLFDFRTLEPGLRILTGLVIAEVPATCLLLLFHGQPFGEVEVADPVLGELTFSVAHYYASCAILVIGFILFACGLAFSNPKGAGALVSAVGLAFILGLFGGRVPLNLAITAFVYVAFMVVIGANLGTVGFAVIWGLNHPADYKGRWGKMLLSLLLVACCAAILLWLFTSSPLTIAMILSLLAVPLGVLFFMAAVDWAEIIDHVVNATMRRTKLQENNNRLLVASGIVLVVALVLGAGSIGPSFGIELIGTAVVGILVLLLLRAARYSVEWSLDVPWVASVIVVGIWLLLFNAVVRHFDLDRVHASLWYTVVMSILLCVSGRNPRLIVITPAILFGVFYGAFAALLYMPGQSGYLGGFTGLPTAIVTLVLCLFVLIRPASAEAIRQPLRLLFGLNVSLCGMFLVVLIYRTVAENAELNFVEAGVVAVAILGEILLSGDAITNHDSEWFSRRSRVFLFFSFVTFTLGNVVFWASMQGPQEEVKGLQLLNNPETSVFLGVVTLGPAMLWTLFFLRLGRWFATTNMRPAAQLRAAEATMKP
jgi:hypothetical protein